MVDKRLVGVLYGVSIDQIEKRHGGMACLGPTKVIALNDFDDYIHEMSKRISAGARA